MSEVREKCVEFSEAEKGLSSAISEYINKAPCLKISYQLTSRDLKVVAKRKLKKMSSFFVIVLLLVIVLTRNWLELFEECRKQFNDFYFFGAVIEGILSGVLIGAVFFILSSFITMRKKMSNISEISVDLSFFEDCVLVRTSSFMSLIEYSSKNNEFIENDHDFIISYMKYPGTESIKYTFPKKSLDNEEIAKIKEYAKKFEDRYIVKVKRAK